MPFKISQKEKENISKKILSKIRTKFKQLLGKPHSNSYWGHLGIARIAFAPPPPHSNGHSGALRLRKKCPKPSGQGSRPPQNQVNSSQKSCPKPSGQGLRPPSPYGQCPNAPSMNFRGASLTGLINKIYWTHHHITCSITVYLTWLNGQ